MAKKMFDQPLDTLERRFQALQDQAGRLPESCREELKTACQEVSQAIAALRAARDAEMGPLEEIPSQEAQRGPKSESRWLMGPTAGPDLCQTILGPLFMAIPDLFNVIDRDFNILMSNWHGPGESVPEADRQRQPKCHQLFCLRDRPCESCQVREVFATGQPQRMEKHNPVDGRTREINAFPIRDEAGRVVLVAEHVRDITERYLAAKALQESEERFRAIFETAQDSIFIKDRSLRYTMANAGMGRLFDRSAADLIGRSDRELFGEEAADGIRQIDQRVLNGEVVKGVHTVPIQGVPTTFHVIIFPLHDDAGEVIAVCGIARDITELKRAEEALRESETKYRTLVENIPQKVFIKDRDSRYVSINQNLAQDFGIRAEEVLGKVDYDFFPRELADKYRADDKRILETGRSENIEERYIQEGKEVWVNTIKTPVKDENGNIVGVLGTFFDITERKRAEQALKESEDRFRAVFETAQDSIFIKDRSLRYTMVNPAMAQLFSRPAADLIGENDAELFGEEAAAHIRESDLRVLNGEVVKEVHTKPVQGVPTTFHVIKVPLHDAAGEVVGLCGIARDITDLKRAEQALRESEATLRTLIEANPEALVLMDTRGIVLAASQVTARRLGKNLAEIIGADIHAIFPPEVGQQRREVFQRVVATGQPVRFEDVLEDTYHDNYLTPIFANNQVVQVAVLALDITARKQAEQALRESEERFRAVFEYAPVGISMAEPKGRLLQNNQAMQAFLGYTADELKDMSVQEITYPEDVAETLRLHQELLAGKRQHYSLEKRYLRKDGGIVWAQASVALLRDVQGEPQYLIATIIDITARKQTEEALRESEERYRTLFETSPDAICLMDLETNFIMWNQRGLEIFGQNSLEQAMARKGFDCIVPEDRPRVMAMIKDLVATGQTQTLETRMLRQDGTSFPSLTSAALIRDAAGQPQAIIGAARDITGIRQAEAELRESEQKLRLMAETIQDVFWIATGGIEKMVYVSPGYEQVWGRSCEELYQSPLAFLEGIHPEDRERVRSEIVAGEAQGIPWSHEYRVVKPDGAVRWIQDRGFPVRDDQGRIIWFTGVATDVTERKALEQQLLQAQKMEAVGRLAGGVAHDFNNLLMAIMGYSELMRAKVHKDDPLYENLENILKAGGQAAALTQQLLTFSRRQIIHPQVIDLKQVILDLEPMLRRLLREDIELEIIRDPMPVVVKGDPGHLSQIIMNLAVNARDAMPRGGRLTLKTAPVDFPMGCRTRFGLTPPGAYVVLEVRDTGVGMDETTQAHIFEPFFTTKEPGKGTGLGLSTVYGIVKQSGGYLDLNSELGKGSAFTILLPRLEAMVPQPKVKIPLTESFRGEETILLVEDEDVLRTLLAKFLRLYGYAVLEARHGGEALLICERHQGPVHLMVTDVVMPQMSGPELADRLTPLRPEMQVLYMSGYTDDAMVHHGVADLSVPFLQKPFKPIDLARQVHDVLHP